MTTRKRASIRPLFQTAVRVGVTPRCKVERVSGASDADDDRKRLPPFLRWAGGKQILATQLLGYVPADAASRKYFEPFLGAATLFFAIRPTRAHLCDSNAHLIECYRQVRLRPDEVAAKIEYHRRENCEEHYFRVRERYNEAAGRREGRTPDQAARFIYLNRTCFNGIFRVNRRGQYNVPYGDKARPKYPSRGDLREAGSALKTATLYADDYQVPLAGAGEGDFVYFDPPYPPLNGTSYFQHYTKERFSQQDQQGVAEQFRELAGRKCLVMMTNADTTKIRALYRGFDITRIHATRFVSCKLKKHRVREVVIRNYGGMQ